MFEDFYFFKRFPSSPSLAITVPPGRLIKCFFHISKTSIKNWRGTKKIINLHIYMYIKYSHRVQFPDWCIVQEIYWLWFVQWKLRIITRSLGLGNWHNFVIWDILFYQYSINVNTCTVSGCFLKMFYKMRNCKWSYIKYPAPPTFFPSQFQNYVRFFRAWSSTYGIV